MHRLAEIETDLASRQNTLESAARDWYGAKREIERAKAQALLGSEEKFVAEKRARAELAAYDVEHAASEAEYVAVKAVVDVLSERASICQSLLKAHSRA
jgi:hypothetical protein